MEKLIQLIDTKPNLAKIILKSLPDRPGIAAEVFSVIGNAGFNIELIAESGSGRGETDLSFAIRDSEVEKVVEFLKNQRELEIKEIIIGRGMGMLTIYGEKLGKTPGVAGRLFKAFAKRGINIEMIGTSLSSLSVLIPQEMLKIAEEAVKEEFSV